MLSLLALLASTATSPPAQNAPFYAAIWDDLALNGMIYNGNGLAQLWWEVRGPDQHIGNLGCKRILGNMRCRFDLLRDGGPAMSGDRLSPDKLACSAYFVVGRSREQPAWRVEHYPPEGTGHSVTSMRCRVRN